MVPGYPAPPENTDTGQGPIPGVLTGAAHSRNTHTHTLPYQPDNLVNKSGSSSESQTPPPCLAWATGWSNTLSSSQGLQRPGRQGGWQGHGHSPHPSEQNGPGSEPCQGVPCLSASPRVPSLLDCTRVRSCGLASCSSRLGLEKLTPAPRHGWSHRNTHQGTHTCLGTEGPDRKTLTSCLQA